MSKLLLILGIILIIASVPILLIGILSIEDSPIRNILESTACNPPEKLMVETVSYSINSGGHGQTSHFFCEIEPGQRRNVTDTAVLVIGGSFLIPFGLGVLFTMVGARSLARRRATQFQTDMASYLGAFQQRSGVEEQETVIDLRSNQSTISPQAQQILNSVLGGVASAVTQGLGDNSLSARLTQLEEAYENDLITKEEYDKVRQAILDSMDD